MYKHKLKYAFMTVLLVLPMLLSAVTGWTQVAHAAKDLNLEDKGSLTIHKFLNPNYLPGEFQGDGTEGSPNVLPGSSNKEPMAGVEANGGKPLKDVGFSAYGPFSEAMLKELGILNADGSVNGYNAEQFAKKYPAPTSGTQLEADMLALESNKENRKIIEKNGKTDANGTVKFGDLPVVDQKDLTQNRWLVIETALPKEVDQPSAPVVVNIPVSTPASEQGADVPAYNYDVHLYMKNYSSSEPEIEKTIDETTHGSGQVVKYDLKITDLPDTLASFKRLEVYDALDEKLSLLTPIEDSIKQVTLKDAAGKDKTPPTFTMEISDDPYLLAYPIMVKYVDENGKIQEKDVTGQKYTDPTTGKEYDYTKYSVSTADILVRTGKADQAGKGDYIYWGFTKQGIEKLEGTFEQGDYLNLPFEVETNQLAEKPLDNDAELGFENEWGYETEPVDPVYPPTPPVVPPVTPPGTEKPVEPNPVVPKPSEVVNTILGQQPFRKIDQDEKDPAKNGLEGAEFIVKDVPTTDVYVFDKDGKVQEVKKGTPIYALMEDKGNGEYRVIGWTTNEKEATRAISGVDGKFNIDGLAYTNRVEYEKFAMFRKIGPQKGQELQEDGTWKEVTMSPIKMVTLEYVTDEDVINSLLDQDGNLSEEKQHELEEKLNGTLSAEEIAAGVTYEFYKVTEGKPGKIHEFGEQLHDYALIEVAAPQGYVTLDKELPFTVGALKYDENGKLVQPLTPNYDANGNAIYTEKEVANKKMPEMPLTGGIGTILFLVVGLALMGGAYVIRRRRIA